MGKLFDPPLGKSAFGTAHFEGTNLLCQLLGGGKPFFRLTGTTPIQILLQERIIYILSPINRQSAGQISHHQLIQHNPLRATNYYKISIPRVGLCFAGDSLGHH
jgi:hypothetical protein